MSAHRAPTPDELLAALDGAPLASDADDALLRLGRALPAAAPPLVAPDPAFVSQLRARLAATPPGSAGLPPAAAPHAAPFLNLSVLLPLVGVVAVATIVFFLPRPPQQTGAPTTESARSVADTSAGATDLAAVAPEAPALPPETAPAPPAGHATFAAPAQAPTTSTPEATSTPPTPPAPTESTSTPPAKPAITLAGAAKTDTAFLTWTVSNLAPDDGDGFAVAWSAKGEPAFPTDQKLVVGAADRSAAAKGLSAGTPYTFRVCLLRGKTCAVFSNALALTTESSVQQP